LQAVADMDLDLDAERVDALECRRENACYQEVNSRREYLTSSGRLVKGGEASRRRDQNAGRSRRPRSAGSRTLCQKEDETNCSPKRIEFSLYVALRGLKGYQFL